MTARPDPRSQPDRGIHLATIAHEGRLWETYLDFDEDPHQSQGYRARLRFQRDAVDGTPLTAATTTIIIEDSHEAVVAKARSFDDRQLQGLLRSALPDGG